MGNTALSFHLVWEKQNKHDLFPTSLLLLGKHSSGVPVSARRPDDGEERWPWTLSANQGKLSQRSTSRCGLKAGLKSKTLCFLRIRDWRLPHRSSLPRKAFPTSSPCLLRIRSGMRHTFSQGPGAHNGAFCDISNGSFIFLSGCGEPDSHTTHLACAVDSHVTGKVQ